VEKKGNPESQEAEAETRHEFVHIDLLLPLSARGA
jgi:hypothetical protein